MKKILICILTLTFMIMCGCNSQNNSDSSLLSVDETTTSEITSTVSAETTSETTVETTTELTFPTTQAITTTEMSPATMQSDIITTTTATLPQNPVDNSNEIPFCIGNDGYVFNCRASVNHSHDYTSEMTFPYKKVSNTKDEFENMCKLLSDKLDFYKQNSSDDILNELFFGDDEPFNDYFVVTTIVELSSGSDVIGYNGVYINSKKIELRLNSYCPELSTDDMAQYDIFVKIPKSVLKYVDDQTVTISTSQVNEKPLENLPAAKPVIYLYPEEKTDVSVKLDYKGELWSTYPLYNSGWDVTAYPDGKIINKADGLEYSYLFWDGYDNTEYDMSKGFVVKGKDTAEFLQQKLSYMGLNPKEYNEFIVYWLPQMEHNNYNLITFQGDAYTDTAKLDISPEPDSLLRIFMTYKPLEKYQNIDEQQLTPFERKGFTVIEWGGSKIN